MTTFYEPKTWVPLEVVTASDFNKYIRDNVKALSEPKYIVADDDDSAFLANKVTLSAALDDLLEIALASPPIIGATTPNAAVFQSVITNPIVINGAAKTTRRVEFKTESSLRWTVDANSQEEIGTASGSDLDIVRYDNTGTALGIAFKIQRNNGQIYFPAYGTGTMSIGANGLITVSSDQRLKTADGEVEDAIDKVMQLTPRYFFWNDEALGQARQLGFFAQEVAAVIPEAAPEPDEETKTWGIYDRALIAILVKAIQEQQARIEQLEAQLND